MFDHLFFAVTIKSVDISLDFSDIGNLCSIVSLLFTALLFFKLKAIHAYYKRHLLVPNILKRISVNIKNIEHAISEKRADDLTKYVKICDANLERLEKNSDSVIKERLKVIRESIKKLNSSSTTYLKACSEVVVNINAVLESGKEYIESLKWEKI